jgi:hypothetical protein
MDYIFVLAIGFLAGAFLTRRSVWQVIEGKARFAVVPKSTTPEPHRVALSEGKE